MPLVLGRIYNHRLSKTAIVLPAPNMWVSHKCLQLPQRQELVGREHAWILLRHQEKHFAYFSLLFFFKLLPQKDSSLSEQEFPSKVAGDGSILLQNFTALILPAFAR